MIENQNKSEFIHFTNMPHCAKCTEYVDPDPLPSELPWSVDKETSFQDSYYSRYGRFREPEILPEGCDGILKEIYQKERLNHALCGRETARVLRTCKDKDAVKLLVKVLRKALYEMREGMGLYVTHEYVLLRGWRAFSTAKFKLDGTIELEVNDTTGSCDVTVRKTIGWGDHFWHTAREIDAVLLRESRVRGHVAMTIDLNALESKQ
jgi:hypothetical protein